MKFHTQLKAKDIFKFSLAYTYSGVQAILTIFMLGVGAYMIVHGIGQPEGQTNIIFGVVVIALFVVINPLMIYVKAKKQAIENPVYKNPTYYTLRDDGIFVELGEESATIEWNRVYKITHFMGRISGGITGSTSMIIHSGLLPDSRKASTDIIVYRKTAGICISRL